MTIKYVVCDPKCAQLCDAPDTGDAVRRCRKYGTKRCDPPECCINSSEVCIPATPEQIASAKLRGLI